MAGDQAPVSAPQPLQQLQRSHGNQFVQRLVTTAGNHASHLQGGLGNQAMQRLMAGSGTAVAVQREGDDDHSVSVKDLKSRFEGGSAQTTTTTSPATQPSDGERANKKSMKFWSKLEQRNAPELEAPKPTSIYQPTEPPRV